MVSELLYDIHVWIALNGWDTFAEPMVDAGVPQLVASLFMECTLFSFMDMCLELSRFFA